MTFFTMNLQSSVRFCSRTLWTVLLFALAPAFAASTPAPAAPGKNTIVSTDPMKITVENDTGTHGQFVVAPEILSADTGNDLVYTITEEPQHGRVGLAGEDEDADFFKTKTSQFGYFAYQPDGSYEGPDSFSYAVRNTASGLAFANKVEITVTPPAPVLLGKFEVEADRLRSLNVRAVSLATRPNTPVSQKVPSHEDFMTAADRTGLATPKVVYLLDDKAKPQHGTAQLDPATGQLTYAPDPGFIGQDHFKYYTVDRNNPQLGMENTIAVSVEPIRHMKHLVVDRAHSREVDLILVINNSPSMAAHQQRLAASLSRFRQLFNQRDLDYRIGVLTTDFVNGERGVPADEQQFYKKVRAIQLDAAGRPVLDRHGRPEHFYKHVASNGDLVTLPVMPQPWVTPATPDSIFAELVQVGSNGDSNRTAFTAVYNFVANYYNKRNSFLRPDAATFVVFFMDEEETRMAVWKHHSDGSRTAEWIESGKLPDLIEKYNARHPRTPQTLDGYINYWVLRPFIIAKGNKRGSLEIDAVVSPHDISHRRAAELTGGTVLNINSDFSAPLAALGDRIANNVSVPLDPADPGFTLYPKSLRVLVDGQSVSPDPRDGFTYDERTRSIRFHGAAKQKAFRAKIDITYEEHM